MKKLLIILFVLFFIMMLGTLIAYPVAKTKWKKMQDKAVLNIAIKGEEGILSSFFVVVVPSYNNQKFCEKNLESIFSQRYSDYRVIYIDDASTDNTYETVQHYIEKKRASERVSLIRNETNQGALANLYHVIHSCRNDEIIVLLDGDDWFAHDGVLSYLNRYYANKDVWMTYGQYIQYPSYQHGMSKPVDLYALKQAKLRHQPWVTSHLRTFYAGLFKKINKQDLQWKESFYPTTYDLAIMFPMMEMAREHVFFTEDIMYVYNFDNPINDGKVNRQKQMFFEQYIRALRVYNKIKSHPSYF